MATRSTDDDNHDSGVSRIGAHYECDVQKPDSVTGIFKLHIWPRSNNRHRRAT